MKALLLILAAFFFALPSFAQPRSAVTLNSATIFLNGAELAGSAKVSLPSGESEMLFTNIAGNVNQQSLSIGAEEGVVVQSATFQNNYLGDAARQHCYSGRSAGAAGRPGGCD